MCADKLIRKSYRASLELEQFMTRRKPSFAKAVAMARPMPREAPVMSAVFISILPSEAIFCGETSVGFGSAL